MLSAGQIDLTVGSNTAMSAMLVALVLKSTNNIFLALIVALIFGVAVGVINGLLVTRLGLPAFLATLGMMQVIRGAAMWITNTEAVPISNTVFNTIFGTGFVGPISVLILWTILFYILGYILFNRTPFGKHTLATGGNQMAAQYSGIKVQRIKMYVFMLSGALSAFAGVLYAGRMQSGRYSFGDGDEMSVIASVVLGGASMAGGSGSIIGALAGSILMGMISNALILANLSSAQQKMGILEALQGGGIDDATKEAFLGNKPYITGCGGLDELYAVMRGESFQDIAEQCGGIVSVTYSPAMIQTAIQDMVDHLDGEEVEQDHVIACEIVNSDNVKDYPSF